MSGSQGIYNLSATQVSNGAVPPQGQVYSTTLTLVGAAVAFDLKSLSNLHRVGNIQGIFADNSAGTAELEISTLAGSDIIIPAGSQCLMPLYLSADQVITFQGNGTIDFALLNFPTPAAVWSATASQGTYVGGLLQVQDSAAETSLATIASQTAPVTPASATATGSDLIGLHYVATPPEYTSGQQGAALANAYGSLLVDTEVYAPSYSAAAFVGISASESLPAVWIQGSSTKTVRIKRIVLNCATFATASEIVLSVLRYSGSTAFAGSAISTLTPALADINDSAASAVFQYNNAGTITASPTAGSTSIRIVALNAPSTGASSPVEFDFTAGGKSLVVRGTSDWIVVRVLDSAAGAGTIAVSFDWTEV